MYNVFLTKKVIRRKNLSTNRVFIWKCGGKQVWRILSSNQFIISTAPLTLEHFKDMFHLYWILKAKLARMDHDIIIAKNSYLDLEINV